MVQTCSCSSNRSNPPGASSLATSRRAAGPLREQRRSSRSRSLAGRPHKSLTPSLRDATASIRCTATPSTGYPPAAVRYVVRNASCLPTISFRQRSSAATSSGPVRQGNRDVVRRSVGIQLINNPQPLLGKGKGQLPVTRDPTDGRRRRGRPRFAPLQDFENTGFLRGSSATMPTVSWPCGALQRNSSPSAQTRCRYGGDATTTQRQ